MPETNRENRSIRKEIIRNKNTFLRGIAQLNIVNELTNKKVQKQKMPPECDSIKFSEFQNEFLFVEPFGLCIFQCISYPLLVDGSDTSS